MQFVKSRGALLQRCVSAHENEVGSILASFSSLCCLLASYFVLMPLREEAGITLGTNTLPKLFTATLVGVLIMTPLSGVYLSRQGVNREVLLRRFYLFLGTMLLIFYVLYSISSAEAWARSSVQWLTSGHLLPPPPPPPTLDGSAESQDGDFTVKHGDPHLTPLQRWVRVSFYIWLNVQNLVSVSALWARCADVFPAEAASRLFGFISAGATLGQLMGSLSTLAISSLLILMGPKLGTGGGGGGGKTGTDNSVLVLSALLMYVAAFLSVHIQPPGSNLKGARRDKLNVDARGGPSKATISPTKVSPTIDLSCERTASELGTPRKEPGSTNTALRREISNVLPSQSSADAKVLRESCNAKAPTDPSLGGVEFSGIWLASVGSLASSVAGGAGVPLSSANSGASGTRRGTALPPLRSLQVMEGFTLIAKSRYLLLLCSYLLLTYVAGSLMYFQRTLVVATMVTNSRNRSTFFASVYSASAAIIIVLQMLATGRMLKYLGITMSLLSFPVMCCILVLTIGRTPSVSAIAVSEILRKVLGYALVRPAREVLFTVVSREEKYKAKLTIDAVVQRLGDTVAAAVFEIMDVRLHIGPQGVALAGAGICVVWAAWALRLGMMYNSLATGLPTRAPVTAVPQQSRNSDSVLVLKA